MGSPEIHGSNIEFTRGSSAGDGEIDFAQIIYLLRKNKWLFVLFAIIGLLLAGISALNKKPIYQASALVQVNDQVSSSNILSGLSSLTGQVSKASPAQVQQELLQSRYTLEPLITALGLNISASPKYAPVIGRYFAGHYSGIGFSAPKFGLNHYAWGGEKIKVASMIVPDNMLDKNFIVQAQKNNAFKLFDSEHKFILSGEVGKLATSQAFSGVAILINQLFSSPGVEFNVSTSSMADAVAKLQSALVINEAAGSGVSSADTGILNVSLNWSNAKELPIILNKLISIGVENNIKQKSEEAAQSLKFINDELPQLQQSLGVSEEALNDYRGEHGILDIDTESKMLLQEISDQENNLAQLKMQKASLLNLYTPEHPVIIGINDKITAIQASLQKLEIKIATMPHADQRALTLMRDVKSKEILYSSMLTKAQELKLMQAGTTGDMQILNYSTNPINSLPMHKSLTLITGIFFGLFVAFGYVFLRQMIYANNNSLEKIENALGYSVCGNVPFSEKQYMLNKKRDNTRNSILANTDPSEVAIEALRSFRTYLNLKSLNEKNNIIAILGASPNIGKSFVAVNIAYLLSDIGKSVLLIDADMRRGVLYKKLGIGQSPGLSEGCINVGAIKINSIFDNLDFISCGSYIKNPAELLMTSNFREMILKLNALYDVIILDTPPVLAVTDAVLLAKFATANFLVIGEGVNTLDECKVCLSTLEKNDIKVDGLIRNFVHRSSQEYSAYSYSYDYAVK